MRRRVFHSFPKWQLSGVNTWSVNLALAMKDDPDFEHVMLITGVPAGPVPELDALGLPYNHLPLGLPRTKREEWKALKAFLEASAPCVYIPNYDFHRSCAVGTLSPRVKVCAVIHSDEDCYYDEVRRLGRQFDAIVAVSSLLARNLARRHPELRDRLLWIPHGVPSAGKREEEAHTDAPLRLVYCNRIAQYQKRILDLPDICRQLVDLGVDFHLTVAGSGPDEEELGRRFERASLAERVSVVGRLSGKQVRETLLRSDIFLLTSDFEGLPISLLEAMSAGCVPVVYGIESGVRDVITEGIDGLLVAHGDCPAMARAVASLDTDRLRLKVMAAASLRKHKESFSLESMASAYRSLFQRLGTDQLRCARRDGRVRIPYYFTLRHRVARKIAAIFGGAIFYFQRASKSRRERNCEYSSGI